MKTIVVAGLAWAFWMWAGCCGAQDELKSGHQYGAGTAVVSKDMGIALNLPEDWQGTFREKGAQAALLLNSSALEGLGIVLFLRDHPLDRLHAMLAEPKQLDGGVVLALDGKVENDTGRLSARYLKDSHVGRALAMVGPQDITVVFFFAGPLDNEPRYVTLLENLLASTRFSKAHAGDYADEISNWMAHWARILSNVTLKRSRPIGGSGGTERSSEPVLHLCAEHRFGLVEGETAGNAVLDAAGGGGDTAGRWQITFADQQTAVLVMNPDGGGELRLDVSRLGDEIYVGNTRGILETSDRCR